MIREKSCGAVIYYVHTNNEKYYLIERAKKGHKSLCKGHVENNETEIETALREIREETGLKVKIEDGFRETIEYAPYQGCMKEVVFFVARASSLEVTPQESEVSEIYWLPYTSAMSTLTHQSDKDVLTKAREFLMGRDEAAV